MPINEKMIGRIIVIKFLKPRSSQADRIGVIGVNLFGYARTADYFMEVGVTGHNEGFHFMNAATK